MKYLALSFSLVALVTACSERVPQDLDLFMVFDHSHAKKELEATRDAWAAGVQELSEWMAVSKAKVYASYARVASMQANKCWIQDIQNRPVNEVLPWMRRSTALSTEGVAYGAWNAAATWLYQNYWSQEQTVRRILFIVTHNRPRHDLGIFKQFSSNALITPDFMCPFKNPPVEEQEIWSLKRAKAGVLVICYDHPLDKYNPYDSFVKFFKENDFTDYKVVQRPTNENAITLDVRFWLSQMVCPFWLRTTTTLPPCKTKQEVTDCLLNEIDRSRFPNTYAPKMMSKCFIPSCFDWNKSYDCVLKIDKDTQCNWIEDLFSCIEN